MRFDVLICARALQAVLIKLSKFATRAVIITLSNDL